MADSEPKLLTDKKLSIDLVKYFEDNLHSKNLSVDRINLGTLFCRAARADGWDQALIDKICTTAFDTDRDAPPEEVGTGTYRYLTQYSK